MKKLSAQISTSGSIYILYNKSTRENPSVNIIDSSALEILQYLGVEDVIT